jgi:hypothetical protein
MSRGRYGCARLREGIGPFAGIEIAAANPHQRANLDPLSSSKESSTAVSSRLIWLSMVAASRIASFLASPEFEPGAASASN